VTDSISIEQMLVKFWKSSIYLENLDGIDYEDIKKIKEVNSKADLLEFSRLEILLKKFKIFPWISIKMQIFTVKIYFYTFNKIFYIKFP